MTAYETGARLLASALLVGTGALGMRRIEGTLPPAHLPPSGLLLDAERADGEETAKSLLERAKGKRLARRVNIVHDGKTLLSATIAELGGTVESEALEALVSELGHVGSRWRRAAEARRARDGEVHVALVTRLTAEPLSERLSEVKETLDKRATDARWDFRTERAVPERAGTLVDIHATLDAIETGAQAADSTPIDVALVVRELSPAVTANTLPAIDKSAVVGHYETRFAVLGDQAGRAQNVARAAAGIDGVVVVPHAALSFNEHVGPRSVDNGFSRAGEIYKGEMRLGVGGGTCQVASTLHAAAFFGGLDVVTRSPHSRPSGYIPIGLDATVVYPDVDLRLRNPFEFPVVVRCVVRDGTLSIALLGERKMADVKLATATVSERPFKRKVDKLRFFPEGRVVRKQAGRKGVILEKVRTVSFLDGRTVTETTRDSYPPTTEIYLLGPGASEAGLPPLEVDEPGSPQDASATADGLEAPEG